MTRNRLAILAVLAMLVAVIPAVSVSAAETTLEEDIETSIVAGLAWLAEQQQSDGSFGYSEKVAHTGLAVLKFEDRAIDLGFDPLDPDYAYSPVVQAGLNYIVANSLTQVIGVQPAGDPDGNGDGIGAYWSYGYHQVYNTGIAMMALAASGHPETYGDLLQNAVDWMSWAQIDEAYGVHRGGWRYVPNQSSSDNSTSGYATLGLGYAAAPPPLGFGLTIPQWVLDEHTLWIDQIQDAVNGDTFDGGSHYTPGGGWVNILKTGNLLYEMGLVGDTADAVRVQDAVDYIERHWGDPIDIGWLNHRQAMFTMMKGLEALGIQELDLDGGGVADDNWFEQVAQHLVATQETDGSWPQDYWGDKILSTSWALLTLERAVPVFEIPVPFDVHPTSCRNPFNVDGKGVLPVAILGTEDFDVTQIDPVTVMVEGIAPLRWALEDVATPFEPYQGKVDAFDCTTEGFDGFMDLTLKFKHAEVAEALPEVEDGEVLLLHLTGNLLEEFGGTPIVGEDVIVIIKK